MAIERIQQSDPGKVAFEKTDRNMVAMENSLSAKLDKVIGVSSGVSTKDCSDIGIYKNSGWVDYPAELPDGQGTLVVHGYVGGTNNGWVSQEFISPHTTERYVRAFVNGNSNGWIRQALCYNNFYNSANGFHTAWYDDYSNNIHVTEVGYLVHVRSLLEVTNSATDVKISETMFPKPAKDWWIVCNMLNTNGHFNIYMGWDGYLYSKTGGYTGIFSLDFTYRKA